MRILVTGASGFLGKRYVEQLVSQQHEVTTIGRSPVDIAGATFLKADLTDKTSLESVHQTVGKLDLLVHLAALVPKTADEDIGLEMLSVNTLGPLLLLEVFGDGLKGMVYASTAEVYGLPSSKAPLDENFTPQPLSYYGASKLAGELMCCVYGQKHNLPITSLRFSVMYGPGDTINRAVPNFINKAFRGEPLEVYGGEELRDYLHLDDAVQALLCATQTQANGIFNIGSGKGISVRSTAELIAKQINPELSVQILPRQKPASDIVLDITRAKEDLSYDPKVQFPDKLDEQIAWHKQQ